MNVVNPLHGTSLLDPLVPMWTVKIVKGDGRALDARINNTVNVRVYVWARICYKSRLIKKPKTKTDTNK